VGAAGGALGNDVGGGGGAFFCRGKNSPGNPVQTLHREGQNAQMLRSKTGIPSPYSKHLKAQFTSSSGSFKFTHWFFFSSQTICQDFKSKEKNK
jgi:hypothetical protein